MQSLNHIIKDKQDNIGLRQNSNNNIGLNKYIKTNTNNIGLDNIGVSNSVSSSSVSVDQRYKEAKQVYDALPELVNEQYKGWYLKKFYALGRERVMILASQARQDGVSPPKLFSHLLFKTSGV